MLFLYTDHHRARTTGALVSSSVPVSATTGTKAGAIQNGSVSYGETARRIDTLTGYVDTSAGRIVTTRQHRPELEQHRNRR